MVAYLPVVCCPTVDWEVILQEFIIQEVSLWDGRRAERGDFVAGQYCTSVL